MDRKDLKIQALLERVARLTAEYENQVADLRVELTTISQALSEAQSNISEKDTDVSEEDSSTS